LIGLNDVLDRELLDAMIAGGYVSVTCDPSQRYRIFNYTASAQYQRYWNDVTRTCRGLIVGPDDIVVARPFVKFFNYGEPDVPAAHGPVCVTDKADGSLGIVHRRDGRLHVATRGSFTSDQALHATDVLTNRYAKFDPDPALTYLVEIVYPENRIVVDYGGLDDLVLLGAVDVASGRSVPLDAAACAWPGPVVDMFDFESFDEVLAAGPRDNREGVVVHYTEPDVRVKVKYDEYVRLHRIVTGLSTLTVWEHLKAGLPVDDMLDDVPDEWFAFVEDVSGTLVSQYAELSNELRALHADVLAQLPQGATRKEFALKVLGTGHPMAKMVFSVHDGRPVEHAIWDLIRPKFRKAMSAWE
jgi:RNA ligase